MSKLSLLFAVTALLVGPSYSQEHCQEYSTVKVDPNHLEHQYVNLVISKIKSSCHITTRQVVTSDTGATLNINITLNLEKFQRQALFSNVDNGIYLLDKISGDATDDSKKYLYVLYDSPNLTIDLICNNDTCYSGGFCKLFISSNSAVLPKDDACIVLDTLNKNNIDISDLQLVDNCDDCTYIPYSPSCDGERPLTVKDTFAHCSSQG